MAMRKLLPLISRPAWRRLGSRLRPAARLAAEVGLELAMGEVPDAGGLTRMVEHMANRLMEAARVADGGNPL